MPVHSNVKTGFSLSITRNQIVVIGFRNISVPNEHKNMAIKPSLVIDGTKLRSVEMCGIAISGSASSSLNDTGNSREASSIISGTVSVTNSMTKFFRKLAYQTMSSHPSIFGGFDITLSSSTRIKDMSGVK
jgi:hypothetical protein